MCIRDRVSTQSTWAETIKFVLEHLPVLVYHGKTDLIVPPTAAVRWTKLLDWKFKKEFNTAQFNPWRFDGRIAGSMKSVDKLTLILLEDAGHLAPHDQPKAISVLLQQWINKYK
eukprot:TRINITY_DN1771_c0_g2_i2.p1 TRINITY_DN1771_c0_g2~~TRINITY_DN1771_c0_g2_i2.p1  ORF type:complete len:129 (-),score=32.23 TRINITY_DN1771_c0_g2_i2:103-444(-)